MRAHPEVLTLHVIIFPPCFMQSRRLEYINSINHDGSVFLQVRVSGGMEPRRKMAVTSTDKSQGATGCNSVELVTVPVCY